MHGLHDLFFQENIRDYSKFYTNMNFKRITKKVYGLLYNYLKNKYNTNRV